MPSTLFLLLTILTAPAVPPMVQPVMDGRGASLRRPPPTTVVIGRLGEPAFPARWPTVPSAVASASTQTAVQCRLRIGAAGIPLVRVDLTPHRSAWFVIDTGATGTTIHTDLANHLDLETSGLATITTVEGSARVQTMRLRTLRIAGVAEVHVVDVAVHDLRLVRHVTPEAEGILGQDVLAQYDYLIDTRRQRLTVGRFGPPDRGVQLPLSWSAGRPVLQIHEGPARYGLVLDTGADVLVMEAGAARETVGDAPPVRRTQALLQTHVGARAVEVEHHVGLRVANIDLPPVDLVRLPPGAWAMSPEVGLLPAALFSRVYVSARTGEAVVWAK